MSKDYEVRNLYRNRASAGLLIGAILSVCLSAGKCTYTRLQYDSPSPITSVAEEGRAPVGNLEDVLAVED